jgi:large subunit ribosomal protein L23Ae
MLWLGKQPKYPGKSAPTGNKLDYRITTKFPRPLSTTKQAEDNNTLMLAVEIKGKKHLMKQAVTLM